MLMNDWHLGGFTMRMDFEHPTHPRIAIYSQDGFGLGHMRRTTSIALEVLRQRPDAAVLTLSDSQLGQFFQTAKNHDYVKLPSIVKSGPGDWRAANLPLAFSEVHQIRTDLIRSALLNFRPHLLLVDHMPHGAMGELLPALQALKEAGASTRVVLGLRDILDAPEVIERRWQVEGAYDAIEAFYDRVLVYGMQNVFDMAQQYHFPDMITNLLRYCGYVCTLQTVKNAARIRTRYLSGARPGARLIVAMAGGGADGYPMMSAILDAFPRIRSEQDSALTLVAGPFMPPDLLSNLQKRARRISARVEPSVEESLSVIEAADVVVAMAGYNTTAEILRMRKPAILIPRAGPSAEQRTRARLFAARRWVEVIDPDELSEEKLTQAVLSRLSRQADAGEQTRPDLQGIIAAAAQLLSFLPDMEPVETGVPVPMEIINRQAAVLQ